MRDHESHGAEAHKYLQAMFIYRPEERGCSASVPLLPTWCRATEAARPLSGCQEDKRPPGALTVLGLRARGVLAGPSSACRGRESPGGCMSPHPASHHVPAVTTFSVLPAPCCPGLLRGDGALQVQLRRGLEQAFCLIQARNSYPSLLVLLFMHSETQGLAGSRRERTDEPQNLHFGHIPRPCVRS